MSGRIRTLSTVALMASLTTLGAFLRVPLGPSGFTLQTLFTAMAGVLLGARYGACSQLVYLGLGLIGLPVFFSGGGIGYVLQPTFGFLLGLVPCAWLIGYLTRHRQTPLRIALATAGGFALLYLIGLPYMALILNGYLGQDLSWMQILQWGMLPFLVTDGIKLVLVSLLCPKLLKRLPKESTR